MLAPLLTALLLPTLVAAQDPVAAQQQFDALPAARQLAVLASVEAFVRQSEDPDLTRIRRLAGEARDPPRQPERTFHDPAVYAPVAPRRTLVPSTAGAHAAVRSDFPPVRPLRDFVPAIVYDWGRGAPVRAPVAPTPAQRFANLLAGYHPDADAAIAAAIVWLDRDGDQRPLAQWCEQLYADRDGRVYEGISLYEAWYSRRTVEVPDVDAIAFARQVLGTAAYVSPIPDGRRRDRLYQQIHAGFARHRVYRTLCEAAAAAFVTATPALDPTYLPLVDRMHLLWGECGYDVPKFAARLTEFDRAELLEKLDQRVQEPERAALAAECQAAMRRLADSVRALAIAALAEPTGGAVK